MKKYSTEIKTLLDEYWKLDARVLSMKIDIEKYNTCWPYRRNIRHKIKHYSEYVEYKAERNKNNQDRLRKSRDKYNNTHKEIVKKWFERWTINNPRKAMLCAAASHMAMAIISKLWIRPTVCPHCGKVSPNIDFHHPNHLFWWKWTFCCRSCHYYFNRDKVPASDTIIDLKKLLRESNSH